MPIEIPIYVLLLGAGVSILWSTMALYWAKKAFDLIIEREYQKKKKG